MDAMKPEDVLRAIAEVRGDALCVPTMTTSPAWRDLAPSDLSITCVGFMGGASSLGLGLALAQALTDAGINMTFFVAQAVGRRFSAVLGFESEADAKKATPLIKKAASKRK